MFSVSRAEWKQRNDTLVSVAATRKKDQVRDGYELPVRQFVPVRSVPEQAFGASKPCFLRWVTAQRQRPEEKG